MTRFMMIRLLVLHAVVCGTALAQPAGRDRVYTADQNSNTVSVIDPVTFRETGRIQVAEGPGMVQFTPDGAYAFVVHSNGIPWSVSNGCGWWSERSVSGPAPNTRACSRGRGADP